MQKSIEICISNATKTFSGMEFPAIDDVTLKFKSGEIYGIVGPNGAGKTTLFKVISNLITPDAGNIEYRKENILKNSIPSVALVLDGGRGFYSKLSVVDNLKYFVGIASSRSNSILTNKEAEHWLKEFNLFEKSNSICQTLSRGMLQRLGLAVAMATEAEIILLDEPTTGLDIAESISFFSLIKKTAKSSGALIIFSSHQPETILGLAEYVFFINKGKIIEKMSKAELKEKNQEGFIEYYMDLMSKNIKMVN